MKQYILNLLIGIDILINAILRGSPYETLSSRAHRMREKGQPYWGWTAGMIDALFLALFKQRDHCRSAWRHDSDPR